MTQQDADAASDVVTGIISILDHDAYTLVDPGATHSFASKPFLDRFQIETQPLEGRMRVSLPAGDPLLADIVVKDSRVLIEGQEFPADVRPEKFQFLEKGQNRNFDYKKCNFG